VDDTAKSAVVVWEAEGDGWRLDVDRVNERLDRTTDKPNEKNMVESMRGDRKIGEEIFVGQNEKEKKK
jgi:hypothetical protein